MEQNHMMKSITKFTLTLWLAMSCISTVFSADIAAELKGIKGLKHPSVNIYSAGQPQPESFAALAKAGVRHVINLRPPTEAPDLNEAAIATQANLAYYNIPIKGAADLTRDKVDLLDRLLKKIGDEKVLMHCSSSNRVGALMALRSAWIGGASTERAIKEGERHGLTKHRPKVEQLLAGK